MSETIKYFNSDNVNVFPSAYRADKYSISWLPTEQNWLVNAGKKAGKNTYVISANVQGSGLNNIKFVLGGYYFEINETLPNYKNYALAIKVLNGDITDNNNTYTQKFLAPYESTTLVCLDIDNKFKGLAIVEKNATSGASEFLLLENLEKYYVIETSIQRSTGKHSFESTVEDSDTVNDVNGNYSVALGHANKVDSNESFAFGSNNTIENVNSIAIGKSNTTDKEATYLFGQNLKNETSNNKVVIGSFNEDASNSVFEIGNGTAEGSRKNILTVQRTKTTLNSELEINASSKQISYTGPKLNVNNLIKLDDNNLTIETDTNNFTGSVDIDGATQIDNDSFSVGSTSTKKIVTNATNTTINNNEVNVIGKTTITGETAINGNTSITGNTVVTGATTINGNTTIVGDSVDYKQTSGSDSFFSTRKEKTSINTPTSIDKLAIGQDAVDDTAKLIVNGDEKVGAIVASGNITAPSINITGTELGSLGTGLKKLLLDATYPIGSIYTYSGDATVPQCPIQSSLGGTWTAIEGKFLYAKDSSHTIDATGGTSKGYLLDHTHTAGLQEDIKSISTSDAGKHKHSILVDKNDWHTGGGKNKYIKNNIDAFNIDWEYGTRVPEDGDFGDGDGNGYSDTGGMLKAAGTHSHTFDIAKDKVKFTTWSIDTITGGTKITSENNEANMPPYLVVQMWKRTA